VSLIWQGLSLLHYLIDGENVSGICIIYNVCLLHEVCLLHINKAYLIYIDKPYVIIRVIRPVTGATL
jgi:hypothetical protein